MLYKTRIINFQCILPLDHISIKMDRSSIVFIMCLIYLITASLAAVCVPKDTCINKEVVINPRIQLPDTNSPAEGCRPGWVLCNNVPHECGRRYVTANEAQHGPTAFGAFPYQVMLKNGGKYIGSGVLIDHQHVLTVAHKVDKLVDSLTIHIGAWNTLQRARNRTAKAVIFHEDYKSATLNNDIAIIRLNGSVPLGYQVNIGTGCLPDDTQSFVGKPGCVVAGWGDSHFGANNSPFMPQRKVTVPIVSYDVCRKALSEPDVMGSTAEVDKYLNKGLDICAGGEKSVDACTQDGGAPLMCPSDNGRMVIAGLVSWGKGCGRPGVYGVYVSVPKYVNWIKREIGEMRSKFG